MSKDAPNPPTGGAGSGAAGNGGSGDGGGSNAAGGAVAGCNKCKITSVTTATSPANQARTKIGVGEPLTLTFSSGSATWSVSGGGTLSPASGPTTTFTAPDRTATAVITAQGGGCSCSITFNVVEPSGIVMERVPGTKKNHAQNTASTGFIGQAYIQPADVSFENIQIREQEVNAVGTGCFQQYFASHNVGHNPKPDFSSVSAVEGTNGSKVDGQDQVAFSGSKCEGTITWNIPWEFKVGSGDAKVFSTVNQVGTFDAAGSVTAAKAGGSASSNFGDASEKDPAFE